MDDGPAFKLGALGSLSTFGAYIAAGERVQTPRGELPIEQVAVGQHLLSGCGRWARVGVVRKLAYRGPMVSLTIEGCERRVRMTPSQQLAIGPNQWVGIHRLALGTVVAVPLFGLPTPPVAEVDEAVAWTHARLQAGWVRSSITTPWGRFVHPIVPLQHYRLTAPCGRFRIVPSGLVALNSDGPRPAAADGVSLLRVRPAAHTPPAIGLELAEQSLRCRRDGEMLTFVRPRAASSSPVKGLPRRVIASMSRGYAGWVFALSLESSSSLVVSGLLARHWSLSGSAPHDPMP